ncbi:MAG: NAD-dependent epimerase/dehydratase family protein [Bdellovibrionota bacterium]
MAKVLVTGGSGFIGTHLCRQLTQEGHEVRVLDLVSAKTPVKGVQYEKGDVRIPKDLSRLVDGVDAVYHLAAMVSVPLCQEQPIESYETNLLATCRVLEAVKSESQKRGKRVRMVFAGSSVVYGNLTQEGEARSETSQLAWPPSFYGAQKLGSEHTISLYHQNHGIPAVVFRFFNVFGPGQDPKSPYSGVISIFSTAIKERKPMKLNGGGAQTRDFVSVHDVARALRMALTLDESRCDANAINLGTGKSITIRGLAEEMSLAANQELLIENTPPRSGDVVHSRADIGRANEILNWSPQVDLRTGLAELLHAERSQG